MGELIKTNENQIFFYEIEVLYERLKPPPTSTQPLQSQH